MATCSPVLLSWQTAFQMAIGLIVVAAALSRLRQRRIPAVVATLKELALVLALFALWQYAHDLAINKTAGAIDHARAVYRLEQRLHFPSEVTLQNAFLHHRLVMEFLNVYYAVMHVPAAGAMLIWLFFRHRDRYSRVRTSFALMVGGCLTLQMIPVAPPRFLPDLGFVDSALLYGQSVYGGGGSGLSNQLAAMPSQHVGWAIVVGVAAVTISRSKWRWLVLLHPLLTVVSVTATANHWWLDGVVAGMVLAVAYGVTVTASLARCRWWPAAVVAADVDGDDDADADADGGDGGERGYLDLPQRA